MTSREGGDSDNGAGAGGGGMLRGGAEGNRPNHCLALAKGKRKSMSMILIKAPLSDPLLSDLVTLH